VKYCSECGHAVASRWIAADGRIRYVCDACGTTHYQNPRVIVSCAVCWQDQVLMCRRSQEPARGLWTLPAGFLECGETLEAGAARETFEETGVVIDPSTLLLYSVVNIPAIEQVVISFRVDCEVKPMIRFGSECLAAAFMRESDVPSELLAWRTVMGNRPRRFFDEIRSRNFTIQQVTVGPVHGETIESHEYRIHSIVDSLEGA
jgi:ADP-ribose pyrophosphatase YjhB (NUDIX family)